MTKESEEQSFALCIENKECEDLKSVRFTEFYRTIMQQRKDI